jgi:excisionase family DNA binding protein
VSERPSADLVESVVDALRPLIADVVREEIDGLVEERLGERKRWLTLGEAAERLGCSADAVRMRARRGRIGHRYQGRRFYVSADDVDRL